MKALSRKEKEKLQRRNAILDATESILKEKGIDAIRMDDVAAAAELSKGTLYLYFRNKTELSLGVANRGFKLLHDRLAGQLSKEMTGLQLIRQMGKILFEFADIYPHFFKMMIYFDTIGLDVLADVKDTVSFKESNEMGDELVNLIKRYVQIGIQDGSIDSCLSPHDVAIQIMGSYRGLIQLSALHEMGIHTASMVQGDEFELKRLFESFAMFFERALIPQK